MKRYLVGCYAVASILSLASCQEDVKNEAPVAISITSPQADEKVWLNIPLKAEIATAQAGDKVMFYLDDELLGEDAEAPYELMLDTKQYKDGAYTLRTVVQNGGGEPTEALRTINIFNKLFSLKVGDNYLGEENYSIRDAWLIACDTEGNVIQTEELQNGETITIDRRARTDETLIISIAKTFRFNDNNRHLIIESYQGIAPNAWFLEGSSTTDRPVIGTARVDYEVSEGMKTLASASNAYASLSALGADYQASLDILEEPAGLFIANNAKDGSAVSYAWLDNIQVDQQYNLEVEDFQPMKLLHQVSIPPVDGLYISVSGAVSQMGTEYEFFWYNERDEVADELFVYHPDGLFDSYHHSVFLDGGKVTYYHTGSDPIKSTYKVPEVSANLMKEGPQEHRIQLQGDYEADFATGQWEYVAFRDSIWENVAWSVYAPVNEGEYRARLHQLPTEIINRHQFVGSSPQDMQYKATNLSNYDGIQSLSDYLDIRYQVDGKVGYGTWEEIAIRATDSQGGRTIGTRLPKSIAKEIEALRIP